MKIKTKRRIKFTRKAETETETETETKTNMKGRKKVTRKREN